MQDRCTHAPKNATHETPSSPLLPWHICHIALQAHGVGHKSEVGVQDLNMRDVRQREPVAQEPLVDLSLHIGQAWYK